jgi:hypothetical protein
MSQDLGTNSPIYVLSKGRAGTASSPRLLEQAQLPYILVVEPQEADAYAQHFPLAKLILLPQSNKGIAYVRNHILSLNLSWFWMLDDDIKGFYRREKGRMVRIGADIALAEAEQLICSVEWAGQGAIEYQQVAWSTKKDYALNSYCDVCVLLHAERVKGLSYRGELALKEDRDFTLQILSAGLKTVRVQSYGFAAPKNGSNAGGLKELYQEAEREKLAVDRLCAAWPEIVSAKVKNDGRYDAKINWRYFKDN